MYGQEGAFVITSMTNGKDWTASVDSDTRLGYNPEDNQWVYFKGADGSYRIILQRVSDNTEIAELKPSGTVKWDWDNLIDSNGESIFFKGAKVLERKNIVSSVSAQTRMLNVVIPDLPGDQNLVHIERRIIYSNNGKQAVIVDLVQRRDNPNAGFVCLIGSDGKPIVLWTENFDLDLPYVTR